MDLLARKSMSSIPSMRSVPCRKYGEFTVNDVSDAGGPLSRGSNGRWLPGNPGRPTGSRNRLATEVLDTFLADFKVHGAASLVRLREERPSDYWRVATQLLPQQVLMTALVQTEDADVLADIDPATKRAIASRG
jgi:hypothetical protein